PLNRLRRKEYYSFSTCILGDLLTEYVTIEKDIYVALLKKVEKVQELQRDVEELKNSVVELQRRLWIYENPNVPSSKRMLKEKKEEEDGPERKRGAPEGHVGATRKKPKPNRFIDLRPKACAGCNSRNIEVTRKEKRVIEDIRIEKVVTEFTQYRYHCNGCGCDHVTTHP